MSEMQLYNYIVDVHTSIQPTNYLCGGEQNNINNGGLLD